MEKTKLGISVALLSAVAFLSGYMGFTAMALICGYILIREENMDVRRSAAYAVSLSIVLALVSLALAALSNFLNVFDINSWMYEVGFFRVIRTIISFFNNVVSLIEKVAFGLLAVLSAVGVKVKFAFLDKYLEK